MFSSGSQVYIVAIAPDGTRSAYRLLPETVQMEMKNDYSFGDHIFLPKPLYLISQPKTTLELSGVLDEGRFWKPGMAMKEI